MEKVKKYIFLSWQGVSIGLVIGTIFAIAGIVLDVRGVIKGGVLELIALLVGLLGVVIPVVVNAWNNKRKFAKAFGKTDKGRGLLTEAISACLDAAEMYDKRNIESLIRKNKYKSYLQEIVEADKIYPIELKFDDKQSPDDLFSVNSTMSITEAPIWAWKAPEYQWFLLNHYASTLLRRLKGQKIGIYDRYQTHGSRAVFSTAFSNFSTHANDVLKAVASCGYSKGDSVRFYLVDKNRVSEFEDMLKQFIAGHELFGVYVFFIDNSILNSTNDPNSNLKETVNTVKKELYHNKNVNGIDTSKDVLDLMVVEDSNDLIYKYSKEGKLEKLAQGCNSIKHINDLLKEIANRLLTDSKQNQPTWLIYPTKDKHEYSSSLGANALNEIYSIIDKA